MGKRRRADAVVFCPSNPYLSIDPILSVPGLRQSLRRLQAPKIAVSPIVGTVNLKNANSATGAALPNTDITANPGGQPLPQRSNMLVTAGFWLRGFDAQLRAYRP